MKTKEFKTYLPCFPGFYETYINGDSDLDCELYELNCDYEDLDLDYESFEIDQTKAYCSFIEKLLKDELSLNCEIVFEELVSPREYNFSTDSVNITIKMDKTAQNRLIELINENYNSLTESIKINFTDRDGFCSFHSNNIEDWKNETENWTRFENTFYLGYLLEVMLCNIDPDMSKPNEIEISFLESPYQVFISSYIRNYDDLEAKNKEQE